ncbi:hypothetical protein EB796_012005 [Bugula neritina]|uniref:NTAN1 n=1 Tax=Bugula neritina TaxID=10212 RepID=A0A7J7JVC4_BUGNE|nr:hypothetical protein EB796_012005 [Bugula neritina]
MPLFLNKRQLGHSLFDQDQLLTENSSLSSTFKALAETWISKPEIVVKENVLYVGQREYAVIDPHSKGNVEYIASDSATTCHIVVFIQPESRVVGLSHFDGCNTEQGVYDLIQQMDLRCGQVAPASTQHSYDVYIFGGFQDTKGYSIKLAKELFRAMHASTRNIHVKVACVFNLNSRYEHGTCYPIYYGVGVNCDSMEIHRVRCENKGPMREVKGARNFIGPKQMMNCYDNSSHEMILHPFSYQHQFQQIDLWLSQSDKFLLKHLSTSPEQEPEDFVPDVRQSLMFIASNPDPSLTIFKENTTLRFRLASGFWQQC